jgi:Flp pilus assembly protein TadG
MKTRFFQTRREKGAVAIIAAVALPALVGFTGLALDTGRLYVEKTELQNATDACALAAARELTCDPAAGPCANSFLVNAENSGIAVAARNRNGFQKTASTIAAQDIRFSTTFAPNSSYLSRAGGASTASRFVMCSTQQTGIVPWFMQVVGAGNQTVTAQAVATLAPAQANCAIPLGMCKLDAAPASNPFAGLVVGQWVTTRLSASATGSFDWIDFTPPGGGASELAGSLAGSGNCSVPPPPTLVGEQGKKTSLGRAWNTRFGLYKGGYAIATSPPDYTGQSYTPTSWPSRFNAYAGTHSGAGTAIPNFLTARTQHRPYQGSDGLNINLGGVTIATTASHNTLGADRRLATVPMVDCASWKGSSPQTVPVLGYACALMLHPMDKDNGPSNTDDVWIEYRGRSTDPASPCATSGSVGGPGSVGPLVPSLVQ